jgi:hypothetical protein
MIDHFKLQDSKNYSVTSQVLTVDESGIGCLRHFGTQFY